MARACALPPARGARAARVPVGRMGCGRSRRRRFAARARGRCARRRALRRRRPRRTGRRVRPDQRARARRASPARRRRMSRSPAIPADVLARGPRAGAFALRRQQAARRDRARGHGADVALDGAAPPRGVWSGRARACARSFAGSRAASRRFRRARAGRFSLLYVDDLATAVLRWLDADAGDGRIFELDDGRAGGYDWDTVLLTAARVLREGAPVRRIRVPTALLRIAAHANLAAGIAPRIRPDADTRQAARNFASGLVVR